MGFIEAEFILDQYGRPVFVIGEDLPDGMCEIHLHDEEIEFHVENQQVGQLKSPMPEMIAYLATNAEAGIIVYTDDSQPVPTALSHVASLKDKRGML